jgi:tetratricopeptide (TPR) repeat protein
MLSGIFAQDATTLVFQINTYLQMNNDKDALRYAEEGIGKFPDNPDFYYFRGIINNQKGKYSRALDDFDYAIGLPASGNSYKYYMGRGISHLNLLEYDLALNDLSKSIELNDTVASAYHSRAMVNYEMHDYSAAVEDFLKALDYFDGNSALYFNLGMSYFRLNQKDKSCPYFHKACTLGNNNACRMVLMECAKAIPTVNQ